MKRTVFALLLVVAALARADEAADERPEFVTVTVEQAQGMLNFMHSMRDENEALQKQIEKLKERLSVGYGCT